MSTNAPKVDADIAAPMDMLLTSSAKPFISRIAPNGSWAKLAKSLASKPGVVADRTKGLAGEIVDIIAGNSERTAPRSDFRFKDPAWNENPVLQRVQQSYLAVAEFALRLVDDADLDWSDEEKVRFAFDNIIEGLSPSNIPFLSPLTYKAIIDTGGLSALRGAKHFLSDMRSAPRIPEMVDTSAFAVGDNIANTRGSVVLRTRMFELIQYSPQTEKVYEVPLLVFPPVINRYYVLDLAPGRSLFEFYLQNGFQLFAVSWRNPSARHRDWGVDEYGAAIIEAIDAVRAITGQKHANILASCSGGMLTSMALAHLADLGRADEVTSLSLAVTVLDQWHAGTAPALTDQQTAERAIKASQKKGYLDGASLAEVFAWLRPTDLVWRYWVNNYIQGRRPAAFDILYWNADAIRMAANLHRDLVQIGLKNSLATAGEAEMLGTKIDLKKVTQPAYVIGGIADHICPWQSTFRSAQLLGGDDIRYVLSSSGHIASLVNPPGNKKSTYRVAPVTPQDTPEEWLAAHETVTGTWWTDHIEWLGERSGGRRAAADHLGGGPGLEPLGPAPGEYVHEK
ncbi:alpha/beta fold hydrolase [Gordonia sp. X0973]|uniref:PHA/PHB synthase family protein n=1 Tax=Gordonia sp. X0973 TaxID=2742602 RepID=UPI000F534EC9|nr:alpha/beta fold hydrolase [Gordonia sp. X0973]QKT06834.1 alpha/beta fold hydrolase [Gordonia sp. X0973]